MFLLPSCAFVHSEDRSKARPCAASAFRKGHPGFSFNLSGYFANVCHSLVSVSGIPNLQNKCCSNCPNKHGPTFVALFFFCQIKALQMLGSLSIV